MVTDLKNLTFKLTDLIVLAKTLTDLLKLIIKARLEHEITSEKELTEPK
jgi:hypothetical protein